MIRALVKQLDDHLGGPCGEPLRIAFGWAGLHLYDGGDERRGPPRLVDSGGAYAVPSRAHARRDAYVTSTAPSTAAASRRSAVTSGTSSSRARTA